MQTFCEVKRTNEIYIGYENKVIQHISNELKVSRTVAAKLLDKSSTENPIECSTERFWKE